MTFANFSLEKLSQNSQYHLQKKTDLVALPMCNSKNSKTINRLLIWKRDNFSEDSFWFYVQIDKLHCQSTIVFKLRVKDKTIKIGLLKEKDKASQENSREGNKEQNSLKLKIITILEVFLNDIYFIIYIYSIHP